MRFFPWFSYVFGSKYENNQIKNTNNKQFYIILCSFLSLAIFSVCFFFFLFQRKIHFHTIFVYNFHLLPPIRFYSLRIYRTMSYLTTIMSFLLFEPYFVHKFSFIYIKDQMTWNIHPNWMFLSFSFLFSYMNIYFQTSSFFTYIYMSQIIQSDDISVMLFHFVYKITPFLYFNYSIASLCRLHLINVGDLKKRTNSKTISKDLLSISKMPTEKENNFTKAIMLSIEANKKSHRRIRRRQLKKLHTKLLVKYRFQTVIFYK